jgi:hypothetical protein
MLAEALSLQSWPRGPDKHLYLHLFEWLDVKPYL